MEEVTEGISGTTRGFPEDEDTNAWSATDEAPHTTLRSSTSGQVDSDLRYLEPFGEVVGSSSGVSSTTSSEVDLFIDLPAGDNKEAVPLDDPEETDSPPRLNEWEKTDVDSATASPAAGVSEKAFIYTQSPDIVTDPSSESAADYQSDPSTDSYFLVSAEAT